MHGNDSFNFWPTIASSQKSFDIRYSDYRSLCFHISENGLSTNPQNSSNCSVSCKRGDDDSIIGFYRCTTHRKFQSIGTIAHTYAVVCSETPAQPTCEIFFKTFHAIGKNGLARSDDLVNGGFDDRPVMKAVLQGKICSASERVWYKLIHRGE
ncbi:MAG: hypothetical protein RLZZ609_1842 [Cyanobacteriota bacterium]